MKGDGPVKVVSKPNAKPTFPEIVEEKIETTNGAVATNKPAPVVEQQEKPAPPFITSQTESIIPNPAKIVVKNPMDDAKLVERPCTTKEAFEANLDPMDPVEELTKEGNKMTYIVVTIIIIAAAVGSYFAFFN